MEPANSPKTYTIKSFGCQMTICDGEWMSVAARV